MRIFSAAGVFDPMLTSKRVAQSETKPARVIFDAFFISYLWERAVRWGIAVIGTQTPIASPTSDPITRPVMIHV